MNLATQTVAIYPPAASVFEGRSLSLFCLLDGSPSSINHKFHWTWSPQNASDSEDGLWTQENALIASSNYKYPIENASLQSSRKEEQPILNSHVFGPSNKTLKLYRMKALSSGIYSCETENEFGKKIRADSQVSVAIDGKKIMHWKFNSLEKIMRVVQLKYMKKRMTTETVQNGLLMFHPNDAREWVIRGYNKRLEELEISARGGLAFG